MRFPVAIQYADTNETLQIMDHRMVFQLADVLNLQNGNDSEYKVNFIKWIQDSANDPSSSNARRPDGTVPGAAEVEANPVYQDNTTATFSNATAVAEAEAAYEAWTGLDTERIKLMATNVYRAHKLAVEEGLFDFSEAGYLKYALHLSTYSIFLTPSKKLGKLHKV